MTQDPGVAVRIREMMDRQLAHMVRLIDDLMEVSRITSGKVTLRKERVSLRAVAETALEASRPIIDASRHTLRVNLPEQPVWLTADPTRLSQVVGNLLTNAAKYTPEGGSIELEAVLEDGEVVIRVTDTGLGIPPGMLDEVFEMFTQVNRTLDRSQGGLGIGLALVKRIVELHGGTITAESPGLGKGATFTVRLPLVEAGLDGAEPPRVSNPGPASRRSPAAACWSSTTTRTAPTAWRVLIEIQATRSVSPTTAPRPWTLLASSSPRWSSSTSASPRMDGYEVAKRLRRATVRSPGPCSSPSPAGGARRQAAIEGGRFRFSPDKAGRDHGHRRDPGSVRRCRPMRNELPGEAMQEAAMLKLRVILEHFLDLICRCSRVLTGRLSAWCFVMVLMQVGLRIAPAQGVGPAPQPALLANAQEPIFRLEADGPSSLVTGLDFAPDGLTLYVAGWDKTVQVWKLDRAEGSFSSIAPRRSGCQSGRGSTVPSTAWPSRPMPRVSGSRWPDRGRCAARRQDFASRASSSR